MTPLRAGIARSAGACTGVVFDLPGCSYSADSAAEVHEMLPLVAAEHTGWLARHGEMLDPATAIDMVEEIDADAAEGVEGEFVFADDQAPLIADELARGLRWMAYARHDLLAAINSLPDEVLGWRPPSSAMMRVDPWKPAPLTIREIVADIANAETYYRTALRNGRGDDGNPPALSLDESRTRLVDELTSLAPEERGRVYRPIRSWQEGPEVWTARKVVRRVISHERFHTAEIQQRAAWLLLGIPDFRRR